MKLLVTILSIAPWLAVLLQTLFVVCAVCAVYKSTASDVVHEDVQRWCHPVNSRCQRRHPPFKYVDSDSEMTKNRGAYGTINQQKTKTKRNHHILTKTRESGKPAIGVSDKGARTIQTRLGKVRTEVKQMKRHFPRRNKSKRRLVT